MVDKVKAVQWACYGFGICIILFILGIYGRFFVSPFLFFLIWPIFSGLSLIGAGYFVAIQLKNTKILISVAILFDLAMIFFGIFSLPIYIFFLVPKILLLIIIFKMGQSITEKEELTVPINNNNNPISQPFEKQRTGPNLNIKPPNVPINDKLYNTIKSATDDSTPVSDKNFRQSLSPIIPYLEQYVKNQKNPLENLEKFYEFLVLKKVDLTPELKEEIKKKIEESIEEQKKRKREEELSKELFGAKDEPTPALPQSVMVVPVPLLTPDSKCQVCLSEFSSAESGAVKCPHCGNQFHYRCISKWVNKNETCPICKKELKV